MSSVPERYRARSYRRELNKLAKEGGPVRTVSPEEMQESIKKSIEDARKAKEEAKRREEVRIKNLKCPACKSSSKTHHEKRNDNGIIGPGFRSWLVEDYYVCKKCGCMFKDLKKPKQSYFDDYESIWNL